MPVKAKAGDDEKPQRQANGSPSIMDETVCGGLPPHLLKVPEGIVATAIDGVRRVVMLTGDNRRAAAAIAQQEGSDASHAELLPKDKVCSSR